MCSSDLYRGLFTDYRLQLGDGQVLSAMTGRQVSARDGEEITIGVDAAAIIPLHDD